ncbi:MAG: c-type cytochrome [Chthoniobacterales bacterium]
MIDEPDNQNPRPDTFEANRESDDLNVRDVHGAILREKDDPRDGYEPIPLWLVSFFMALVFWGGAYLAFNSGGFESTVFNPSQVSWTGGGAVAKGPPDPKVVGKRLFTANCVACHQATGQGVAGQFPTLVESEWVLTEGWHGDNHLVSILLHGLQGPIQVKGSTYNGAMPPWKQLKDDQIAAILTYIRSEWGNNESAISAEQVAKIREETTAQTEPYTQAQLQAIPAVEFEDAAAPAEGSAPPAPDATAPAPAPGA